MDERDSQSRNPLRGLIAETLLAGVGAVALTADRVNDLVDALAERGQLTREEARELVEDVTARWRGDAGRLGERASVTLGGAMREVGLVTRREWEELELRLSQLEHRLRLVEGAPRMPATPPQSEGGRGIRRRVVERGGG